MNDNTEDKMILKVLGSGTCVPRIDRASSGYFIKYKQYKFLLDCGPGVLRQLVKAREDYKDLTGVIFSHFHPDHCSDFIPLIQALNYTPGFKRKKELLLIGSSKLEDFAKSLYKIYNVFPEGYDTAFVEPDGKFILNDEISISSIKGNHSDNSSIIKITYKTDQGKEKGFVYSGDTDFDENIPEFAKNIDTLILECSYPQKVEGHLTPEEAGRLANMTKPRKLLLTHFYPPSDNPDIKIQHRVKEHFIGQVILAHDLMEIVI